MDDSHLAGHARNQPVTKEMSITQILSSSRIKIVIIFLVCVGVTDLAFFYTMPLHYLYPVTFDEGTEPLEMAAILFNDFDPTFTTINNETKRRMHHAMSLMKNNRVKQLIVVGGNRSASKRKGAHFMADYLIKQGVPGEKILVENNSKDSVSNLEQLGKMLTDRNIDIVGLISSPYHMMRLQTMHIPFTAGLRLFSYNPANCFPPLTRPEIWFSAHYNALAYFARVILPDPVYTKTVMWIREHTEW